MEIYATNISNLTDARYFAALGAKWMEISTNGLKMNSIEFNAMKEWVTGAKWVLNLGEIKSINENSFLVDSQIEYLSGSIDNEEELGFIHLNYEKSLTPSIFETKKNRAWIINKIDFTDPTALSHLHKIARTEIIYLNIGGISSENIVQTINTIKPKGVVFSGGSEEKIGFKSFDEIDDIIELLIQSDLL